MPIYEYECSNCKFYSEIIQKISDAPLKKCPSCGKSTMKKLISAPVFRLKGSGWYETDFKAEGENKRNLADAEDSAKPEADSDKKAPTKAAKKAPPKAASRPAGKKAKAGKPAARKPAKTAKRHK